MNHHHSPVVLLFMLWAVGLAAAPAPPVGTATPSDRILQQELRQEQLRVTTQRVADQLESVIAEFDRNAISGEDVQMLRAIRQILGRLSEKDMQLVVGFLQQSRQTPDATASTRQATEAFALQQSILVQLKQLVLEYQRQQELYELALRFKELARRQSENLWLGVALERTAGSKTNFNTLDESQRISLQLQQSQQTPLREETALTVAKLEQFLKDIGDSATAARARTAASQARSGGLLPALDAALADLHKDHFRILSAIGNEKKARDQMREVARLLILAQDPEQALRQALHELDRTIDQQKQVRADTARIETRPDAEHRALDQAQVVDGTDLIRRDIDNLAPIVAEQLKKAGEPMQDARTRLASNDDQKKRRDQALPKQDEAINQLQQARQSLADHLAKLEEKKSQPENALAALRELQEQVRELIQQEEKLKQETAAADKKNLAARAPDQGALKDQAQELQEKAAQDSPAAADSLREAANQMDKAQTSLAQAKNNAPAQQAALDALRKAEQQLGEDLAKLEQAEQDLSAIEDLLGKLEPIIEEQEKVHLDTAKEAAKPKADQTDKLASQQEKLGQQTGDLQKQSEAAIPEASKNLSNARQDMNEAQSELAKPSAKSAQKEQSEALSDLFAAKHAMESKANELREMLGQPPLGDEDTLDDALRAIEEALAQVNEAQSDLEQAPSGLMDALQQQQEQIAESLGNRAEEQPETQPGQQAQKSAKQAAQELGRRDLKAAVESMKQAQAAMRESLKSGPPNGSAPQPRPGEKGQPPSLSELSQQQAGVQKAAEAMLAAQQHAPKSAMQSASKHLQTAGQRVLPLTTGEMGDLPDSAEKSLEQAMESLNQGSAQAEGGQSQPAQQSALSAEQALAQAHAALSMAQAGLGMQMAQGQQPGQGKQQGQGQQPGKGQKPGRGTPPPRGDGQRGNWDGAGGSDGARNATIGSSGFTGLPQRDRAAILQSQSEKYPQEYGPLVEQYLKNLADQAGSDTK